LLNQPGEAVSDSKLLAVQARAQVDAVLAAHQAQLQQQRAQNDAIHLQVEMQGKIELVKIAVGLASKTALFDAHLRTFDLAASAHATT